MKKKSLINRFFYALCIIHYTKVCAPPFIVDTQSIDIYNACCAVRKVAVLSYALKFEQDGNTMRLALDSIVVMSSSLLIITLSQQGEMYSFHS